MKVRSDGRVSSMQWLVILALAATSLVFVVNVNDSTMLKRPILYFSAGLLAAMWLSRSFENMKFEKTFSAMDVVVAAYVAIAAISLLNAPNLRLGAIGLADIGCFFILFMVCTELFQDRRFAQRFLNSLMIIAALACLVAFYQIFSSGQSQSPFTPRVRETISTFGNVTYFAGFLAPMVVIIAAQIMVSRRNAHRLIMGILLLVMIYILITTESRSGWAGAAAGVFLLIFLNVPPGRTRWIVMGSLLAAGILIFILFPGMVQRRFMEVIDAGPTSSIARRLFFYRGAWKAFLASPLFGQGLGNFTIFLPKFRSPDYWMAHSEDIVPHAHNEFLEILSETGVAGFLGFMAILIHCFRIALGKLKKMSPVDRVVLAGLVSALAAILVDNLASMNLRTIPVAVTFWIILAFSHRMIITESRPVSLSLSPWKMRKLRLAPYVLFGALLVWYIPRVSERYRAQQDYLEGDMLRFQQRTAESSFKYREAISHDPYLVEARLYLAANLAHEGRNEEARRNIDTLLMQSPYYPKARFIRAVSLFGMGDTVGAANALTDEMKLETSPQTVYYASYFQGKMNRPDSEYALLRVLLENSVRSGSGEFAKEGIDRLSDLFPLRGTPAECVGLISDTRRTFPADVPILLAAEEFYEHAGLLQEAEATLKQAQAINPGDPEIGNRFVRLRGAQKAAAEGQKHP